MSDTTQAPFTLRDGLNLALYDWPLPLRMRPRAVVLIVHGLGEHAWRYDALAQRLNDWGFCVRAYDQRGHGESGGAQGVLPDDDALLTDLSEVLDDTRRHLANPWACPLILFGHSMGGHGALTLALKYPEKFKSVSAFAPICAPSQCPWGEKAFSNYLGSDQAEWLKHDATALVQTKTAHFADILIDQGLSDQFYSQLNPALFQQACQAAGQPLTLREHAGYDHGYYFIQSFIDDHLQFHAVQLES